MPASPAPRRSRSMDDRRSSRHENISHLCRAGGFRGSWRQSPPMCGAPVGQDPLRRATTKASGSWPIKNMPERKNLPDSLLAGKDGSEIMTVGLPSPSQKESVRSSVEPGPGAGRGDEWFSSKDVAVVLCFPVFLCRPMPALICLTCVRSSLSPRTAPLYLVPPQCSCKGSQSAFGHPEHPETL